ncbi:non-specific protein-tyrosine kinase, partial [Sarracenia purpurea var. burkii]
MKVKHDKDYASALSTVASQGQKVEKLEDMKESNVLKAWKVLMEELENLGKLFKSNADTIEKKTLDKLNTIYNEKRKAKKHYQDEYNRLCQQFSN